jgi:DNA mismatch endonuclease (patch repair protein)
MPVSDRAKWTEKFEYNVKRDRIVRKKLRHLGWKVLVIWECQLSDRSIDRITERTHLFLRDT